MKTRRSLLRGLAVLGAAASLSVPAQAAGVEELAVVAPPTKFGAYNADLLATCHELGIREVYRVGGAQGVATLAYGVEGIPQVDKIVGPGNLFVALAKKTVYGDVDIDAIAGSASLASAVFWLGRSWRFFSVSTFRVRRFTS